MTIFLHSTKYIDTGLGPKIQHSLDLPGAWVQVTRTAIIIVNTSGPKPKRIEKTRETQEKDYRESRETRQRLDRD